jgi:hypothetical protein
MTTETAAILHAECEAELNTWDCFAVAFDDRPGMAKVMTSDGDEMFWVTTSIAAADLKALLRYGQRQRAIGEQDGRRNMQAQLRSLINAAPLEPC